MTDTADAAACHRRTKMTLMVAAYPSPTIGGSYRWLEHVMSALPEHGIRCVVAAPDFPNYPARRFLERFPQAEGVALRAPTGTPFGRQRAVLQVLERLRPDVLVPHLLADSLAALCQARRKGLETRLLYAAHEISPAILADVLDHGACVDAAVGVSRALCEVLVSVGGIDRDRVWHVPYGVPKATQVRCPRDGKRLQLGYAGRLDEDVRADDIVPICRGLSSAGVAFRLEIAGEGARELHLRAALGPEIREGMVTFLGSQSRQYLYESCYPRWDCLLRMSPSEGFPIAITEAMVNGCVPLVSDFQGRALEGVLRHLDTALVFPVGDAPEAVELLVRASDDPGLLARLSQSARAAAEGYTASRMVEGWLGALDSTLSRPPRPACVACPAPPPGGRLDTLLPRVAAEVVRRALGRRHPPMPWPFTYHGGDAVADRLRLRVEALLRAAGSGPAQDC